MTTDITKLSTEDQVNAVLANPEMLDRIGTADLKRCGKMLAKLANAIGSRCAKAEKRLLDMELNNELLQDRIRELTGAKPPQWSYLHREEALRLHAFTTFAVVQDEHASVVCGEENGTLHPIYEFDFEDLGTTQAAEDAQAMLVHLRQTFTPRNTQPKETIA